MATIPNSPRRTVIVIDEGNGSVTVSMARRRSCRQHATELVLDKVELPDQQAAFDLIQEKFAERDAKLNEVS